LPDSGGDKLCPICDSPLQPGSKKCGFCGTDLSIFDLVEEEAPKPPPAPSQSASQSVDARIEEIFSKPTAPAKPAPVIREARLPQPAAAAPVKVPEHMPEPKPEPRPVPVPELEPEPEPGIKPGPAEEEEVFFECPQCGAQVPSSANSCPRCGVLFADEGTEMFQCPACNTLVNLDAKSCPGCGAVFVESDAELAAPAAPAKKPDIEPPLAEVKAPKAKAEAPAPSKPLAEEKKGLFGMFRMGKKEPEPEKSGMERLAPAKAPPAAPKAPEPKVREVKGVTVPVPVVKDKGRDLARMVAEMKPLLALAREKEVEIGESKQLIDDAAIAGRERQLDKAIELVHKSKTVLMSKIDEHLAVEITRLNDEIKLAREFGGDISRATTYIQEVARARSTGDAEAAYVYTDKIRKELRPITGRFNEAKVKITQLKQLIADSESLIVDTREARALMVETNKALDAKDFDKLEATIKKAQEKLYQGIPPRINEEMRKAKDDLLEAKMKNINIAPMITILKSANNSMKAGDYATALKEMREFRETMKKAT